MWTQPNVSRCSILECEYAAFACMPVLVSHSQLLSYSLLWWSMIVYMCGLGKRERERERERGGRTYDQSSVSSSDSGGLWGHVAGHFVSSAEVRMGTVNLPRSSNNFCTLWCCATLHSVVPILSTCHHYCTVAETPLRRCSNGDPHGEYGLGGRVACLKINIFWLKCLQNCMVLHSLCLSASWLALWYGEHLLTSTDERRSVLGQYCVFKPTVCVLYICVCLSWLYMFHTHAFDCRY